MIGDVLSSVLFILIFLFLILGFPILTYEYSTFENDIMAVSHGYRRKKKIRMAKIKEFKKLSIFEYVAKYNYLRALFPHGAIELVYYDGKLDCICPINYNETLDKIRKFKMNNP